MDYFPATNHELYLPLSSLTAEFLASSMLSPDELNLKKTLSILECDPALVLWLVCQSGNAESSSLRLRGLAQWFLSGQFLEKLVWQDVPAGPRTDVDFSDLADVAILRAVQAAGGKELADSEAALLELVRSFPLWFCRADGSVPEAASVLATFPPRLRAGLAGLSAESAWEAPSSGEVYAKARAAHAHWSAPASRISPILPVLADRLRRLRQLEQEFGEIVERQKLSAMKELAYGAGHEINNPLANISSRAQTLLRDEPNPARQRALAAINRQAFRGHEMIADMMFYANPPRLEPTVFTLEDVLETVREEMAPWADQQQTRFRVLSTPSCEMRADRVQIAVALKALVRNSLESLGSGGQIQIQCDLPANSDMLVIRVHDDGPGIDRLRREHIFDPFYSGREAGRGLGFGLAKVWRIVELHGGKVWVESNPAERSTTVALNIPVQRPELSWAG